MEPVKISKRRDLTLIDIGDKTLVIASDSCGGIGEKEADMLRAPYEIVGAQTARVVLMEILSAGAEIISLANALCNEMDPAGIRIIQGIREEMEKAGIVPEVLTGSTEENFITKMTGIGVTGIGICDNNLLKFSPLSPGDKIIAAGRPLVGQEILDHPQLPVNYRTLKSLVQDQKVRELVPVGSKGIAYEAELLGSLSYLKPVFYNTEFDLKKSAGTATVIIGGAQKDYEPIGDVAVIGEFEAL